MDEESIRGNSKRLKFYTGIRLYYNSNNMHGHQTYFPIGLHEWHVFDALFHLVESYLPNSPKISKINLLLILVKLWLNLFDEDIATRFGIHQTTVSRNFHKVLDVMAVKTAFLIKWPDRVTLTCNNANALS